MKKNKSALVKRYGKDAEAVMYGRATNIAKKMAESENKNRIKELVRKSLMQEVDIEVGADRYEAEKDLSQASAMMDELESLLKGFDWYYYMSDDPRVYRQWGAVDSKIGDLVRKLKDMGYGEDAKSLYNQYAPDGDISMKMKEGKKEDVTGPKGKPDGKINSLDYLAKRNATIEKAKGIKLKETNMPQVDQNMTTEEASGHAERFAKYMSNKEGYNFTVTAGSVEGPSFDLDVDGQEYEGGSYVILTNGDIVNMALPGNPVYGNTLMMKEVEKPKTKMKKSELKEMIKAAMMAEAELNVNTSDETPENEEDFLAEIEAILAEADEEEAIADEETDTEVTDDEEVDAEAGGEEVETTDTETTAEVNPNVKAVQDSLTQAQAAAKALGDAKLTDQIGNTITFFTRTHVASIDKGVAEAVVDATSGDEGEEDVTSIDPQSAAKIGMEENLNEAMFPMLKKILK
mgnify:CR=1 FL=1